ncbi:MAG: serine hydrolase [Desulfobacteraceae bacterium]|nr:MAG: serine hydrolase [Desulfobacteraceae bacterium]
MLKSVHLLMEQAVTENVFPGGVLLVSKAGRILFHEAYGQTNIFTGQTVSLNTIFDLASLTKPLASALAAMMLIQENKLSLDQELGSILPELKHTPKAKIQIRHLLKHTSGLPDYRPYYIALNHLPAAAASRKKALHEYLIAEPLVSGIGEKTQYSDIGFMVLEWVIDLVAENRLDRYVQKKIYDPLGLADLFFVDLEQPIPDKAYAATEVCPWRHMVLNGMVHDDNAYAMGGISGQAGLFGNALAVHGLLMELLNTYSGLYSPIFDSDLVRLFLKSGPAPDRALGFDVPSRENSSSGDLFDKTASVGHLGFTGTSFWMDLNQEVEVILLTNRVHPSRMNEKIKAFRPRLHNEVMKCI